MAENKSNDTTESKQKAPTLQGGTYEIIRNRLLTHGKDLRERITRLNQARKDVFGAIDTKLLSSQRVVTENNCIPRDMVPVNSKFLFGYNVFVGLRSETHLSDIFSSYHWTGNTFETESLDFIQDPVFLADFQNLYKYYRDARFSKFFVKGPHLYLVFRVGKDVKDVKTFKWLIQGKTLKYLNNRSDHEYEYPPQHEFKWIKTNQDMHRGGLNPHVSIEERVFVETVGGDLTIKIEDNTESGEGIYAEPVDNPDQTLADADIFYAILDNLIVLKVLPYQEKEFRYFVYNEKLKQAVRIDAIGDACILLPDGHGVIFSNGYYLKTGEQKQFDTNMDNMIFERRITSPNGEDVLFVFYNREKGVYTLLSYNLIEQRVDTPVICNGYSCFEDGTMLYFKGNPEAQKQHVIQVWQTPYYGPDYPIPIQQDNSLYKIGNKDIVRCMADCAALLNLIDKEESYANLYHDISKLSQNILDTYFWLKNDETEKLNEPLVEIQSAATSAIEEFEKVQHTRRNTHKQIRDVTIQVTEIIESIDYGNLNEIKTFVEHLTKLRSARGQVISLKELRYADLNQIESLENTIAEHSEKLSTLCVEFLLDPNSLYDYQSQIKTIQKQIPSIHRVSAAKETEENTLKIASELEMLTEIVSNLKIADATQTTTIIDNISLVYATVNQVKASLKNKIKELAISEGKAEFSAQVKLLDQLVINFLDLCSTPDKCDEYLTKVMVQIESLESKFADYDEFVIELAEKRDEIYNTFESRKIQLVSQRNQRASGLMTAAERILKGIRSRVERLSDINEINGYFASDLMIERVRETIDQLTALGDSVKAEDVKSRLKTLQQDAVRQFKDRQHLFEDGDNVIRLGNHRFAVNHQALEGTMILREGSMFYHLTGTGFFEEVHDEELLTTRNVWTMEVLSESEQVYRAEYLAYKMYSDSTIDHKSLCYADFEKVVTRVQQYMGPRFAEGYIKGVHDQDGALILQSLLQMNQEIGLLRYSSQARALALFAWKCTDEPFKKQTIARIASLGQLKNAFGMTKSRQDYTALLSEMINQFLDKYPILNKELIAEASDYLFEELISPGTFVISQDAIDMSKAFTLQLNRDQKQALDESIDQLGKNNPFALKLLSDWLREYIEDSKDGWQVEQAEEAAEFILNGPESKRTIIAQPVSQLLKELKGSHPLIVDGQYQLHFCHFMRKLNNHECLTAPRFNTYQKRKKELITKYANELRLSEFTPRVLSNFVRNQLIDKVYLPLIGDNLAKQIGSSGSEKRTDRQGLLLMISPPGYGKTTLMEYISNRLGLIFMKINGPALGHRVTSFDPAEAPNAAAREELNKLNLAFEMGDNVMIYVDDIQHCNPEFLQKFISLCDAQRRVEGVYRNHSHTYDLRGKRVCVVMAGNPYTESGEKFKIPDMLTNRADTYNIGDIVGDNYDTFILSYIENCLTSNPALSQLANRSQDDVYKMIKLAQTDNRDNLEFEGNYSADELNDYIATLKKLFVVRDVVLTVNQQYIRSAAQSDEYRTEPPFLLQGSYRNMNRIASRVLPVLNDKELWNLIFSNYEQDAQTLATGAESNLLKFRELIDQLDDNQKERWEEIKMTFGRNKLLGGESDDKVSLIIRQLNSFGAGLDSIKNVINKGIEANLSKTNELEEARNAQSPQFDQSMNDLTNKISQVINELQKQRQDIREQMQLEDSKEAQEDGELLLSVLEEQFQTMETWLMRVTKNRQGQKKYVQQLVDRFNTMITGYSNMITYLNEHFQPENSKITKPAKKSANAKKDKPSQDKQT